MRDGSEAIAGWPILIVADGTRDAEAIETARARKVRIPMREAGR
jgi:hypothetical protein